MNGLDNAGVREMRELFKALRDKGKTILLASHNPLILRNCAILCTRWMAECSRGSGSMINGIFNVLSAI